MPQALYTPDEAVDLLKVSLSTVWRLIRSGELPTVEVHPRPGITRTRKCIPAAELETFIKERANVA